MHSSPPNTEQVVLVGDTKQLPPTVAFSSKELRQHLGISPMGRLEQTRLAHSTTVADY